MISPLQAGDKIAICAMARKITLAEIKPAINVFKSWGLEVIVGETIETEYHQFSGTDEQRIADLQAMLDNPEIKAIISARGGYGITRILDRLNFDLFQQQPKWIIGFSDITALLCHVYNLGFESIHGIMPSLFSRSGSLEAIDSLKQALFGESLVYSIPEHVFNRSGEAEGVVIGGNISLLNTIIGTASDVNFTGKILFVEEIDEYLYNLDRMLVQLKRSGKLAQLAGLLVGHMTDMRDNLIPFGKNAYEIILEHTTGYTYPIAFDFPMGHEPHNLALICGRKARLQVNSGGGILEYLPGIEQSI